MSQIPNRRTKLEVEFSRALWRRGLRFRLNRRDIPGIPDLAFIGAKVAVFCDGSFWHGRHWDRVERIRSNSDYWKRRIALNISRDLSVNETLRDSGWLVLRFWDDELKNDRQRCVDVVEAAVRQRQTG
ncbi:MAG: very short patch repair endonuclease [Phycisphaerales bacterium]|nr:very short patch repair endonuclease [Phycisphaerales bacterium]